MSIFAPGDTPARAPNALSHIVITWTVDGQSDSGHAIYDAFEIGEGQARQRSAARRAILKANASNRNVRVRMYFMDGKIEEVSE